jgi:hypothetical protein
MRPRLASTTTPTCRLAADPLSPWPRRFLSRSRISSGFPFGQQIEEKPLAHNLDNLYAAARKLGLSVAVHKVEEFIGWMNDYHDRGAPWGQGRGAGRS